MLNKQILKLREELNNSIIKEKPNKKNVVSFCLFTDFYYNKGNSSFSM